MTLADAPSGSGVDGSRHLDADVVILGMGAAGEDLGLRLTDAGLDVVGVEVELLGGECPYWACIPSKMMIRAANLLQEARRANGVAGRVEVHPDWAPVAAEVARFEPLSVAHVEQLIFHIEGPIDYSPGKAPHSVTMNATTAATAGSARSVAGAG